MKTKLACCALLFATACSGSSGVPSVVVCPGVVHDATDVPSLAAAVAAAASGDCIVLAAGRYDTRLDLMTPDVWVTAASGAEVTIAGPPMATEVVRIRAPGVGLNALKITGGAGHGVIVEAHSVQLRGVEIFAVRDAAVGIRCEDDGCLRTGQQLEVLDSNLHDNGYGIWARAARVFVEDSRVALHSPAGLAGGGGLYGVAGAAFQIDDSLFEQNVYGVVLDGAGTTAVLDDCTVLDNDEAGVWGQGLRGAAGSPALEVIGARVEGNGVVGVGGFDVHGVSVQGSTIRATRALPVQVDTMTTVDIGDGLGLFMGSQDVQVDGTRLVDNARAQALFDAVGAGITVGGSVTAMGGLHQVVVQNTAALVTVPPAILSMPMQTLRVRPNGLAVPGL